VATGDLTVANGVIKIVQGKLTKQYEEKAFLYNRIGKGKGTKIGDRGIEIPAHLEPNANYTFTIDGGDLPAGGSNNSKRFQIFFKNQVHSMRLTGSAIDSINSGDVSYVKDFMEWNMTETVKTAMKRSNIHAWGTGTGRLATISSGANSATQTVSNNDANRFLEAGMRVSSITLTDGTITASGVILNPRASATTFTTVAAMTTTVTSDIIVPFGGYNLAPMGIRGIIDDTTNGGTIFQGLSRSTYPSLKATRVNASSAGLDISFLRRLLGAGIHIVQGELDRNKLELWSHPAQMSAYQALGWNLRRFSEKSKSIDLGFTGGEYEGINWMEDVHAPKDTVDAINWETMKKFVAKDFGWDDKTGSILRQVPSTTSGIAYTDQFEAYYTARYNFGCDRPNANGFIDSLAVPTGF
jgi:hypothetical protein